jgi:oligopeptide transport system ATP-binding protein
MSAASPAEPLLQVRDVVQEFQVRGTPSARSVIRAVSGVSFDLGTGETLGLVGESGAGKSTLARALMQAPKPTSGSIRFRGAELTTLRGRALLAHRRHMQLIFQDPFGSLNPRWRVTDIVEEPLIGYRIGGRIERRRRVSEVLERVGLPEPAYGGKRPRELSGGQCQRVAIARALTLTPALLICDEAVSALDVLIQAQLLNLFEQLRRELGLSYLFISHDLAVVRQISHRVGVLYRGQLCELGPGDSLYRRPLHPYTGLLLAAAGEGVQPADAPRRDSPSPLDPSSGCAFQQHCPRAQALCTRERPILRSTDVTGIHPGSHLVACHFPALVS